MADTNSEAKWYVAHTYSGYENKVKVDIEKTIENRNLQDQIFEVAVPVQSTVELKNGVEKKIDKKIFPGYVLVHMIMNEDTWYVVRNTPGVTGFIGSSGGGAKPFPVAKEEMEAILKRIGQAGLKVDVNFKVGDRVQIVSGPFSGMEGVVDSMNDQTQVATVLIILFGRETPTDIAYIDLKLSEF